MKNKRNIFMATFLILLAVLCLSTKAAAAYHVPQLSTKRLTLEVGESKTLSVKKNGFYKVGKAIWRSADVKVAEVSEKGRVTGRKKGTAIITAKVRAKLTKYSKIKSYTLKCKVKVKEAGAPVQPQNGTVPGATDSYAKLLYQGQASIRITTKEGKVIYIDPYAGEGYDKDADLILVTHSHYDHNSVSKVAARNDGCRIITWKEALSNGQHQTFDYGFAKVEAVEAGYNRWHDVSECVGYIVTLSDGISIYVTGDTSKTQQMSTLSEKHIDYAFFCCDGVFNMDLEEAAECAAIVGARYSIPYHVTAKDGVYFDRRRAEQFNMENRLIIDPGEEIELSAAEDKKEDKKEDNMIYDFNKFNKVTINGIDLDTLSEEELSILYRQAQYCQAMCDADADTMREIVSEDMVFTHMSGKQQTRDEYLEDIVNGRLTYYTIGIENPKISVWRDGATIRFTSVLNANAYGARGTFRMDGTHHYERRNGEWIAVNKNSRQDG